MHDATPVRKHGAIIKVTMLLCGTAGNALIAFLTQLILTRNVEVAEYGSVAALIATVTLLTPLAGLCIGWFWLELYGREGLNAPRWGPATQKLTGLALALTMLLLAAYISFSGNNLGGTPFLTWCCAAVVLIGQTLSETRAVRLQLEEKFIALALWQIVPQTLRSLSVAALALTGSLNGANVIFGYTLTGIIVAIVSAFSLVNMTTGNVNLRKESANLSAPPALDRSPTILECLQAALPYCLVTVFFLIYSLGILAMVELIINREAAAYYNVSYLIYTSLCIFPSVIYSKFLAAKIFRWWGSDRKMLIASFHLGVFFHLIIGITFGIIVGFFAKDIITILFGQNYLPAVDVLKILAVAVPIRFVQHGYGSMLFSREHIKRKVRYMGMAAVLSAVSMFILAPKFGTEGAALSAVFAELILLLLYVSAAARHITDLALTASFRPKTLVAAHRYVTGKTRDVI